MHPPSTIFSSPASFRISSPGRPYAIGTTESLEEHFGHFGLLILLSFINIVFMYFRAPSNVLNNTLTATTP